MAILYILYSMYGPRTQGLEDLKVRYKRFAFPRNVLMGIILFLEAAFLLRSQSPSAHQGITMVLNALFHCTRIFYVQVANPDFRF